jgi:myo-inositol-1(or 4)-monophosphatase
MDIADFRNIGKRLRKEIPSFAGKLREDEPISKGASGDMTYPIDRRAEEIVFDELEQLGGPLTIVSEEYGMKDLRGGGPRLLIDPIDGSKNAINGLPVFSTALALAEGDTIGNIRLGYTINLVNGDEFWAVRGGGSFYNGSPIKTQTTAELKVITYEAQNPVRDIPRILPVLSLFRRTRCLGSVAIDMALLARGSVSMFVNPTPSRSFDFAAGYLLITEAGGIVTDLEGGSIESTYAGMEKTPPLLASGNAELHEKVLEVLKKKNFNE